MKPRSLIRAVSSAILYPGLLFGTAGTWRWLEGWIFILAQAVLTVFLLQWLSRHDPALLKERLRGLIQPGQPCWDRVIVIVFAVAWLAWFALPGLDAVRYRWSFVPVGWKVGGAVLHGLGWLGIFWTHRTNTFLAPVVRVQTERDQVVIDSGPYAIVRHPMYAALLLWLPGAGLFLGSWWATLLAVVPLLPLVVRTELEDRWLARDLAGYEDYRRRVPYRLIPGIW